MTEIRIEELLPRFILEDKNGFALAKAIEAALRMTASAVQEGIGQLFDISAMQEWRLDEMAWELNALYDQHADLATKRNWIKDAMDLRCVLGTPDAIRRYLNGYFENVIIEEWFRYGGEPYHFRVACSGDLTEENEAWARKAIDVAKNVRSVMDGLMMTKENAVLCLAENCFAVAIPCMMCAADSFEDAL